jgi:hypothetical protein
MPEKSAGWLALAGTIGAIAGAVVSGVFNYLSHRGDLDAKMIELSVGILRSAPSPETTPLREWAIDVIDKRARFEFDEAQRAALLKQELPFKGVVQSTITFGRSQDELSEALKAISEQIKETERKQPANEEQMKKMMELLQKQNK